MQKKQIIIEGLIKNKKMTQQENDKAWENEDNLYTQIKELVKGQRASTVKSIIKRLDDMLLNISFVQ